MLLAFTGPPQQCQSLSCMSSLIPLHLRSLLGENEYAEPEQFCRGPYLLTVCSNEKKSGVVLYLGGCSKSGITSLQTEKIKRTVTENDSSGKYFVSLRRSHLSETVIQPQKCPGLQKLPSLLKNIECCLKILLSSTIIQII